ncbi:MAG: GNAT family N-acetyltransferase [Candidatus Tyrphobacter sp.]
MTRDDKTISSPRLYLAPVGASNAETLWHLMQTPELRTYQDLPTMARSQFVGLVSAHTRHPGLNGPGRYEWLIERVEDGSLLGWVSLRVAEGTSDNGEIGYSLLQEYRGRGYATEAVRALVDAAFQRARLRRVRAYCLPENERSRALLARIGFREDGRLKHGALLRGRAVDVLCYTLNNPLSLAST